MRANSGARCHESRFKCYELNFSAFLSVISIKERNPPFQASMKWLLKETFGAADAFAGEDLSQHRGESGPATGKIHPAPGRIAVSQDFLFPDVCKRSLNTSALKSNKFDTERRTEVHSSWRC